MIYSGELARAGAVQRYWAGHRGGASVAVHMPKGTDFEDGRKAAIDKLLRDHPQN